MSDLHFLERLGAEFARLEAHSDRRPASWARAPRAAPAGLGLALSVLVVVAVVVVSIGVHRPATSGSPTLAQNRISVSFSASPIDPRLGLGPALARAIPILRARLASVPGARILRATDGVTVTAPGGQAARARIAAVALGVAAQLSFYDWEANLVVPWATSVVSPMASQDPSAIVISQGVGPAQPGEAAAGGLSLYAAVRLAARQPAVSATSGQARPGPQYYLFGAPGSAACQTAARDRHAAPVPRQPCLLLAGPVTETSTNPDQIDRDLGAALLPGIGSSSHAVRMVVPQGTVVVQAASASISRRTSPRAPSRYFVLRDRVALAGRNIIDAHPGTDQSGNPDVQFGFTSAGATAFQRVTAQIARRGQRISSAGASLNQHFAVVFGDRLITVPQIDFRTYPDGVTGNGGADVTGGFTPRSAQALATQLRTGPLPVRLSVR